MVASKKKKKKTLVNNRPKERAGIKSGGEKKRDGGAFDRNRLTERRGRQTPPRLTDRRVRIIDGGSDGKSM